MSPPPASNDATSLRLHTARSLGLLSALSVVLHRWGLDAWESFVMVWFARFGHHVAWALAAATVLRLTLDAPQVRSLAVRLLVTDPEPAETLAPPRAWLAAGAGAAGVTALGVAVVELQSPYYFAQDDNLTQFMPVVLQGCESLFRGAFPTWNPYQLLGAPTTTVGTYALTYPVTWLSYALARWGLGDAFAFCDVFCALHLVVGASATVWALRQFEVRPSLAAAGATSFALSGYFLISGRSWFYMTPVALWVPVLFGLIERLRRRGGGARHALAFATSIGLFFHAGNAQMWLYALLLSSVAVTLMAATRALPAARVRHVAIAALLGVALAAPLLMPQTDLVRGVLRVGAVGDGIGSNVSALLLPYPLASSRERAPWGMTHDDIEYASTAFFGGTFFIGMGLLLLLLLLVVRMNRTLIRDNVWLLTGGVAFLFALGREGLLWPLFARLPVFSKLQLPYKFVPFVTLLLVIVSSRAIDRLLPLRGPLTATLLSASLALTVYNASFARASHCSFPDPPYPPPPQAILTPVRPGGAPTRRTLTIAPVRSSLPGYLAALPHNAATVWGVFAIGGYDPIVAGTLPFRTVLEDRFYDYSTVAPAIILRHRYLRPEAPAQQALDTLRAYGVRWLLVHRSAFAPSIYRRSAIAHLEALDAAGRRQRDALVAASSLVFTEGDLELRELPDSAPLAFAEAAPRTALPTRFDAAGVSVTLPPAHAGAVVVNVLARPHLVARVDGRSVPTRADGWGRLVVQAPAGGRALRVDYRPPWTKGLAAMAGLAAVALALLAYERRARYTARA